MFTKTCALNITVGSAYVQIATDLFPLIGWRVSHLQMSSFVQPSITKCYVWLHDTVGQRGHNLLSCHTIAIEVSYDAVEFGVRRIQIHDLLCTITPKTLRSLEIGCATLDICVRHTWCSKIRVRRSRSTSTTHPEAMIRIWCNLFALHSP